MSERYVDADGHVLENLQEVCEYLDSTYTGARPDQLLPSLDSFHTPRPTAQRIPGTFDRSIGPERWVEFLERTGLEYSVLYPTSGLAFGYVAFPHWANTFARAYNDWLHDRYLKASPRLKGMALIPLQDVPSAVQELRRAVNDLGMLGAMIPSTGLGDHLSSQKYWPVYEEAERLDCAMAIHGGCYRGLGFDSFTEFPQTRALGMPFPLAIAATGMIADGVFDRFPGLRLAFLEGGTAWIPLVIDRLERELEYGGLSLEKDPEAYFRSGRVFVGCEGNERALAYAVDRVGPEPFMFASDFPHEITIENCMVEIDEILERKDLPEEHKTAILGGNARRFYKHGSA